MRRDQFLKTCLAAGIASAAPAWAWAQDTKGVPMKVMIPANPGGGWDLTGRAVGRALMDAGVASGVTFDNRGGAAGTIGLAQFVNANKGDPNALFVMGAVMLGGIITGKPPVTLQQATPIARLTNEYNVFVVPANSPYKTLADVIAQFKKDPGSVKWGGGSRGATEHIVAAMLARIVDVDPKKVNYVPFRGGGETVSAILGGNVTIGGSGYSEFAEYIATGKMRALGVTSPERLPGVNIPTLKELGFDIELGNWRGVYGAPGITRAQRDEWVQRLQKMTESAAWKDSLKTNGWMSSWLAGDEFAAFVDKEFTLLRDVMTRAGMVGNN